ncbi:phage portal protein [Bacillus pumilus]|uniref:phage portal protein n=1 Tax=Bacillus pumilus TaxID=1408 RepID=UPI001C224B7F|nr:phage portal protein [Bacillus pumilus]MBU8575007.1 phage portal protein [Bacillus pumilus]
MGCSAVERRWKIIILDKIFKNSTTQWNGLGAFSSLGISSSGEIITPENSLNIGAIFAAVDIKARHTAKLPLQVFKKTEGGRQRAIDHPVVKLLEKRPNSRQTPYVFKHTITVHRNLWGNAYVRIVSGKNGYPKELKILEPNRVKIVEDVNEVIWYLYQGKKGDIKKFHSEEILHVPYLSTDGIVGKSPVTIARETAGTMKAAQKYVGSFYKNGTTTKGILKSAEMLSGESKEKVRQAWEEANSGLDNFNKVAILDGKFDYQSVSMNLVDAEYIATQKFNIAEIARIFNVPLHMLSELDKSSFNNIEHQSMEFVSNTIQPELVAIEEELNYKLFTDSDSDHYVKFNIRSSLRSDDESRSNYYKTMTDIGALSINDVLNLEDMNGIGESGNSHRVSLNSVSIDIADDYQLGKSNALKGGDSNSE